MKSEREKKALAGGEGVAGFIYPGPPHDTPTSAAPAAPPASDESRALGFELPPPRALAAGEYTPDWLKKIGGRKFALTALAILAFAVLLAMGVQVPDWFTALVTGGVGSFNLGAGLARSGGH